MKQLDKDIPATLIGRKSLATDSCALPLVRRVSALLNYSTPLAVGDILPRGWHMALFTPTVSQRSLGPDGLPQDDTLLPHPDPIAMPRKVLGGRRTQFKGDLIIGMDVRRESEIVSASMKNGRSGPLLFVTVRSSIFAEGASEPVIIEDQDSIFREAPKASESRNVEASGEEPRRPASISKELIFDTTMLFRYSAITFTAHRIHYDYPYATTPEGYDGLLVNGGLPALLLLELIREQGVQPQVVTARNFRPLYCGKKTLLCATLGAEAWHLWAENDVGQITLEVTVT